MAYLRIFMGDALLEQRELNAERTTIGRMPDNDIVLTSHGVSKHHATIERQGESFVLIDNGSANGVFIGGKRIRRHRLRYWDEIQVFSYVLKFMAVPRLKGEEAGVPASSKAEQAQEATMEIDISSVGDLAKLRRRVKVPTLSVIDDAANLRCYTLDKVNFRIGKSTDCDIKVPGWLAPRLAACIQRRHDGCYLLPSRRGRVLVNGARISKPIVLHDDDDLRVRGLALKFMNRTVDLR
jgi:predicted component of type VI protein secretion system